MEKTMKKALAFLLCAITVFCMFAPSAFAGTSGGCSVSSGKVMVYCNGIGREYNYCEIQRCPSGGSWESCGTVSCSGGDVRWTDNNCRPNTTYTYRCRFYYTSNGRRQYSNGYCNLGSARPTQQRPQPCSNVSYRPGTTSCNVSWGRVSGCDGYEVLCSSSRNGSYSRVATCQSGTTSCNIGNLRSGNTYYIYVRAYTVINGSRCYSENNRTYSFRCL